MIPTLHPKPITSANAEAVHVLEGVPCAKQLENDVHHTFLLLSLGLFGI